MNVKFSTNWGDKQEVSQKSAGGSQKGPP